MEEGGIEQEDEYGVEDGEEEYFSEEEEDDEYGEEEEEERKGSKNKKNDKKPGKSGFADYEEFAHLLEQDLYNEDKAKKYLGR